MKAIADEMTRRVGARLAAVSRAMSPELSRALRRRLEVAVIPVSGGLTVWEASPPGAIPVVETPNHLGRTEPLPVGSSWTGVRRSEAVEPHEVLMDVVVAEPEVVARTARLAKRLWAVGGLAPFHRDVVAPWFTLLAADPARLVIDNDAVAVTVLGSTYPDIPGGVRLEVDPDAGPEDIAGYAAAVEALAGRENHAAT